MKNSLFYLKKVEELYQIISSKREGLSNEEAKQRLAQFGKNVLPKAKKESVVVMFLKEFIEPITFIMLVAAVLSFLVGEAVDAIVILFIILCDAILGTVQEWKANKSAESLASMIKTYVKVLRDGKEVEIESADVAVGDILFLESGDKVPADARIIESVNLMINESILTGESVAAEKSHADIAKENLSLSEMKNMAFAGTTVTKGRATCLVVATGIRTEVGKIATNVLHGKKEKSPLTIRMDQFSKQICILVLCIAAVLLILLLSKGLPIQEILLSVIALSVSAMPEGLPFALTLALTIGSIRMAKQNVIVKKLNAVESLGSCTVIATDKTGTLTVNEQTLKKVVLPSGESFAVSGTGYNDDGGLDDEKYLEDAKRIAMLGYLNNEATLEQKDGKWTSIGDSIDIAFLAFAKKVKVDGSNIQKVASIPYESENKYSAIYYRDGEEIHCTAKGSVETILSFSSTMGTNKAPLDKEKILAQNEELAAAGYRVMALADGMVTSFTEKDFYTKEDLPKMNFLGLTAFIDPIRKDAKEAIVQCREAGIRVLMITGDHPLTALSIGKELGLAKTNDDVTTYEEIENELAKGDASFREFVKRKNIFSKTTPIQKLKIVNALKANGEFVAVTGDGVNDAPAIQAANIGISMGSGTDVSKETGTMILMDDRFSSIVAGIEEGRCAYSNIRKVIFFLISCGVAEILFVVLSTIFNFPMPLLAIQLLWVNLVTDGLQDIALSYEKTEKSIMKRPPRNPKDPLLDKTLKSEIIFSGIFIGLAVFALWVVLLDVFRVEESLARGYTMAFMVFLQNMHALNCRSEDRSVFQMSLTSNPLMIASVLISTVLQIIVMEVDFFNHFLKTSSIPPLHVVIVFALSLSVIVAVEAFKWVRRRRNARLQKQENMV